MKPLGLSLLVMLVMLIPVSVHAGPELGLVLKGGVDASTITREYRVNRYGFAGGAGGYSRWLLTDRFTLAVQLEFLYTPRGAEVVFEGELQGKLRQHYLDVAATARPEMRLGPLGVYFVLGSGVDLLVSANSENATGTKQDVTSGLRRTDVALLVGAGVALHLSQQGLGPFHSGAVFLEARHDHGLIGIDPMVEGVKNRTSSLMLGLSFGFGAGASAVQPAPSSVTPPATPADAGQ